MSRLLNPSETTPLLPEASSRTVGPTPLPKKQLFALYTAVLIEPIAGSLLQPFIYFMVQDFNLPPAPTDPSQIGWYVSFLRSAFSLAQVLSSIPIGLLSDRLGRRPILLLGIVGNVVCTLLFGLARTIEEAVTARVMLGLVNGNIGVAKSITGEITDSTNRAQAFSMFGFWSSIGGIIGPILGGYLSNPVDKYPSLFGQSTFFRAFPYFLPCLIAAFVGIAGFVASYVCLEETLPTRRGSGDIEGKSERRVEVEGANGRRGFLPPQAWPPVVALTLIGLVNAMNQGSFPLLANTPRGGQNGGLGFGTEELGVILCLQAGFRLITQLTVYPPIDKRLGPLKTLRLGLLLLLITTISTPLFPSIPAQYLYPPLLAHQFLQAAATSLAMTSTFILVTEGAPSPAWLGTINGVAQMGACTSRTVGPALLGWVWKWSREVGGFPWVVWGVSGAVLLGLGVETMWIGRWKKRVQRGA
ncbi:hypothetical protein HDV00_004408 [Rhizophlyctis rosea]|nr:hypothetical protein HDV00_004408 [Rhizophlyctis rosea]